VLTVRFSRCSLAKGGRSLAAAAGLAMLLGATLACASPITFVFSGHITSVAALDPASPFPDVVDFDTPFDGTYTVDAASIDAIPDPSSGSYAAPAGTFVLHLGGLSLAFDGLTIVTFDTPGFDFYGVVHAEDPTTDNPTGVLLQISLPGLTPAALGSDALPLIPPSLALFDTTNAFFFTDTIGGNQVEVSGRLDTLAVAAIPEPASVALLALGIFAMAIRRRP